MKNSRNNIAVSQIIGEIFLLAIAVISVSVIAMQVLSTPGPQDTTTVTIIGKIEGGSPVFELQRGEPLERDTKLFIDIAGGYNRSEYSLDQSFLQKYINKDLNEKWNIGEKIVLPPGDIPTYKGPRVEGTIVDTKTNAIVFWGILQEGIVTRHKGGIWHFDEQYWNGTLDEVKDRSGNNNHGIAQNNATIINESKLNQKINVINNNSGYFDQSHNSYVKVDTSWTLNITNNITIEAWMKPQNLPSSLNCINTATNFGISPYITPVTGNIYATVTEDNERKKGTLNTFIITPDGTVELKDTFKGFGEGKQKNTLKPMVTKISEKIILIAYNSINGSTLDFYLQTFNISANGSINHLTTSPKRLGKTTSEETRPSILRITDNLCVIAYRVETKGGIIKTLNIASDGTISNTTSQDFPYDPLGYDPYILHITGNKYAIAYRNESNCGNLTTFTITSSGDIDFSHSKTIQFDNIAGFEPCLIQVSSTFFAVVYRNNSNYGIIKTFKILSNGSIVWTNNMMIIDKTPACYNPYIVHGDEDIYVVAYATDQTDIGGAKGYGFITTLRIGENGFISPIIGTRTQIINSISNSPKCANPIIYRLNENVFAVCYTSTPAFEGILTTIIIKMETFPPYCGITKRDSYGIFANTSSVIGTKVVGSINNKMVNISNLSPNTWYHFTLTYDGDNIILYVHDINGIQKYKNSTYYPNHRINITSYDLYFGRYYNGYIDEIAIYDKVLDINTEILPHFKHPVPLE